MAFVEDADFLTGYTSDDLQDYLFDLDGPLFEEGEPFEEGGPLSGPLSGPSSGPSSGPLKDGGQSPLLGGVFDSLGGPLLSSPNKQQSPASFEPPTLPIKTMTFRLLRIGWAIQNCHDSMKRAKALPLINYTRFVRDLSKLYVQATKLDAKTLPVKRKDGSVAVVSCPPLELLQNALSPNGGTFLVCRPAGHSVRDTHHRGNIEGTLWRLMLEPSRERFKLQRPDTASSSSDSCTITEAKRKEGCSTSNWESFELVMFDLKDRVVLSLPLDTLREVVDMFQGPQYSQVAQYFSGLPA